MYDFDLENWTPANDDVAETIEELCLDEADLRLVTAQITPDGREEFLALADSSAPYAHGGYPGLRAVHITRDSPTRTVRVECAGAASLAHAEGWLLDRGADPELLARDPDQLQPADPTTREIEKRTREAGNRLRVVDHYSDYDTHQGIETWILMHDEAIDIEMPFVVHIEQELPELGVYSVREGHFPDRDTAMGWIATREGPLPQAPDPRQIALPRAAAARSRTAMSAGPGPIAPAAVHPARNPVPFPPVGPGR